MLAVTILGNNSALPAYDRHPTSQVVTLDDNLFLVDCGEGTQQQLAKYRIRWSRINYIFISHLHGDHYFGLPGFLHSMGLLHREHELHLFAPAPLKQILDLQLEAANNSLPYQLHFYPLEDVGAGGVLVHNDRFKVTCFATKHRIPCWGFRFDQVRAPRRVNPEKAIEDFEKAIEIAPAEPHLYQLRLQANQVTLSGCSTGLNVIAPGDELIGLVRGCLSAGAPSLVVSLWAVDDEATAQLMADMYTRLRAGDTPAAALRAAQRRALEEHQHPFFWAPFAVFGRW